MDRIEMLRVRLEEAYAGSEHHSLQNALKGVNETAALWKPERYRGFPHMDGSILRIAFHVGGDKHVILAHTLGVGAATWETVEARFRAYGGNLAAAKRLAEEGHQLALETLATMTDERLDTAYPYYHGRTLTGYGVFQTISEHDVYHAGQIQYIRCLYDAERRAAR